MKMRTFFASGLLLVSTLSNAFAIAGVDQPAGRVRAP